MSLRIQWNKNKIIFTIKDLKEKGVPLNASYIMDNHSKLYGAARTHCGSWENAVNESGINYSEINLIKRKKKWSEERIIEEIKILAQKGIPLTSDYIQKEHTKLHSAAQRYFKSWGDAVDASGFDYENIKNIKWTEESIINEITRLNEGKEDLSSSNMQLNYMSLFQASCRVFGSWKSAVESSGLDYCEFRKQKEWTPEKVLIAINSYIEEYGIVSAGSISKDNGALYQAARRLFKGVSWAEIVALAQTSNS